MSPLADDGMAFEKISQLVGHARADGAAALTQVLAELRLGGVDAAGDDVDHEVDALAV